MIDDNQMMAECIARACGEKEVRIFNDAITATEGLRDGLPELIFMDVMLTGPDGFTMLNELISYKDTMDIPVVIVTSAELEGANLETYGVVGVLSKDTMMPEVVRADVEKYCRY